MILCFAAGNYAILGERIYSWVELFIVSSTSGVYIGL